MQYFSSSYWLVLILDIHVNIVIAKAMNIYNYLVGQLLNILNT